MRTVTTAAALAEALEEFRSDGERIALVPTMGALHDGHLSLVRLARGKARRVVVSLFVNPKQFGPAEDLDRYPRDLEGDSAKLAAEGVDLLFAPPVEEVYPPGFSTTVRVAGVSEGMEGARRPGHFDGVATVVTRLFCLVLPDVAVFGAKDGQQVAVVRRLLLDLGLPIELAVGETVRHPDGLALSSRNAYLSAAERAAAPVLYRALSAARDLFEDRDERDAAALLSAARTVLDAEPALRLDALDLVDAATMRPVDRVEAPVMLAAAAFLGRTRLIDNVVFG
ncbi:MAG: pantoate--beta-alanine ligase [Acidobacteria bacterium]|nr:MAG: pantoate--beta-alanine ligase [Acidobacteriota bacterium]MCE7960510.1 pantoate--beta-alanine ligase [Acidobacteria bacterium ACB2]